ncbi:hypothetical protein ASZ90_010916 [hydrocarbon metagenome]|uniref:Uncharacterized protein n=1 Tax=hydrocarbon metagenome TaxID=938273 RepID=A0A0W8FGE8_9ZZZZ
MKHLRSGLTGDISLHPFIQSNPVPGHASEGGDIREQIV